MLNLQSEAENDVSSLALIPIIEVTSPRCNGSSNNVNLQRSRYARLKSDTDKLKYEKWSKYRFKPPKCRVWGTPKKAEKGQE